MNKKYPSAELTNQILKCCFDVMNDLGIGFFEVVYKKALAVALEEEGLSFEIEKPFEEHFRERKIGLYIADIVIEKSVILELKCCKNLLPEHQAQLINYLTASHIPIGLLVNFGNRTLEYRRLHHPLLHSF